jgi:hypothetical protein
MIYFDEIAPRKEKSRSKKTPEPLSRPGRFGKDYPANAV